VPVVGIGVDVVEAQRVARALERFGERMERRLFTAAELAYCRSFQDPLPHLAARFAAKEAAAKALGTGMSQGVGWRDFEVVQPGGRQPRLEFGGRGREVFEALGCSAAHLSLTHDGGLAVATVVLEG